MTQKIFISRRNIELGVILKLQQHGQLGRRLRSEVEANARLDHLRLSGGLQVRIENEVGAFVQTKRHSLRLNVRHRSRLPEKQVTVRIEDLRFDSDLHPAKTRAWRRFPAPQRFTPVDQNIGMVHVALVAGTNFDCFHPTRLLNGKPERQNSNRYRFPAGAEPTAFLP